MKRWVETMRKTATTGSALAYPEKNLNLILRVKKQQKIVDYETENPGRVARSVCVSGCVQNAWNLPPIFYVFLFTT